MKNLIQSISLKNIQYLTLDFLIRHKILKVNPDYIHKELKPYLAKSEPIWFRTGHPWGEVHPSLPYQTWDMDPEPFKAPFHIGHKIAPEWDGYKIDVAFGTEYYSGERYIEVIMDVPNVNVPNIWYAVWGHGESAPPEYDIVEIYSDEKGNQKANSDFHYGKNYSDKSKSIRPKTHCYVKGGRNRFGVLFDKDGITYYINKYPVRHIKHSLVCYKSLEPMNLIVSSGLKSQVEDSELLTEANVKIHSALIWTKE